MDINAASSSSHCITNSSFIRSLLRVPADKLVSFTFQQKVQLLLASANQWTQLRLLLKHTDQHLQLKSAIPVTSTAAEIWISTCYNNFTSADWKCFLPLRPQNTFNASTPIRCKKLTVEHIFLSCLQPVIFFSPWASVIFLTFQISELVTSLNWMTKLILFLALCFFFIYKHPLRLSHMQLK